MVRAALELAQVVTSELERRLRLPPEPPDGGASPPSPTVFLRKLEFELAQLAHEDDFQRGLRIARVLTILRAALDAAK